MWLLILLASQHFLTLTSAALSMHIQLFNLPGRRPHKYPHTPSILRRVSEISTLRHQGHFECFCNTKKKKKENHNVTDITGTCWYCALLLCLLSRNIPALILCFLCVHECICVPLWARSCTWAPSCSPLISLMSWICVWGGPLGVLLPGIHRRWNSPSYWYSELLHVEFASIICIPGSVAVSYVCAWCLWLTGSAGWVLKL